jgi:hypothetical protein
LEKSETSRIGSGPLDSRGPEPQRSFQGLEGPLDQLYCAFGDVNSLPCSRKATHYCAHCKLIQYCSRDCQVKHWPFHKKVCKGPLSSKEWRPGYIKEGRPASFIDPNASCLPFHSGRQDFLWGNTPAMDLFHFSETEMELPNLSVFLAASGDLRHFFRSMAGLPQDFKPTLEVLLNDREVKIVARNFIILFLLVKHGEKAIVTVINLWYSSSLTTVQKLLVTTEVTEVFKEFADPCQFPKFKQFKFGPVILVAQLDRRVWTSIAEMVSSPISFQGLLDNRNQIMLHPGRRDYRDRYMNRLSPAERLSFDSFRHHGLLLPYGAFNSHLNAPNTFLVDPRFGWTLTDSADPLQGWDLREVHDTRSQVSRQDHYGALFFYLRKILADFVLKAKSFPIKIKLISEDLANISNLDDGPFDRIDVSNTSDINYLGIKNVLRFASPLLSKTNPEAVLITTFMNWKINPPESFLKEVMNSQFKEKAKSLCTKFSPYLAMEMLHEMADKVSELSPWLYNDNKDFAAFIEEGVKEGQRLKLLLRTAHKIIPKRLGWSMEPAKQDLLHKYSEEDKHLLGHVGGQNSFTRYAEWSRSTDQSH